VAARKRGSPGDAFASHGAPRNEDNAPRSASREVAQQRNAIALMEGGDGA